ncbi:MFS transporter [Achromobacter deleyi]|uniref:MFS transporter n=1 Tax=Achromobacter deleyi TaxID=1353891 RepID=UPI001BCDD562|nr:MFS transporter [Achromobacter deleyi]QVQ25945.1 MFS transporter [Achromobacter deleyi]UIP21485.1 MFS transporter [Achromobacter deleyi]
MTTSALPSPRNPAPGALPGKPAMGRLGLAVLLSGGFITIFDLFVVNVAIPSMQATLAASFAQINFIIAAYELAYGVLLIAGSRLGDRHGRRRLFMLGMAGFALASALCGLAPTANTLIGARVLQGVAAAMLFPQVYALIRVSYEGHARRRAFGLLGMTLGLAAIAGQVLGGWIVHADLFGLAWRAIFLINLPLGLLAWRLARYMPESREPSGAAMDWPGAALVGAGLALLLLALIEGPARHWPAWTLACAAASVIALAAFVRLQRHIATRGGAPLVDMTLLAQPRFAAGCLLVMLVFSTASAMFLCYALLVQTGFGLDALTAGLIFAPASVGFVAGSMAAPRLVARYGTQAIALAALLYGGATVALMLQVGAAGASLAPWTLVPALVWLGAAQGAVNTPLVNLALGLVEDRQAGMAAGVVSTLQQIGAALGVSAAGMLFGGTLDAYAQAGAAERHARAFASAMQFNVAAILAAAVLLWWLGRRRPPGLPD